MTTTRTEPRTTRWHWSQWVAGVIAALLTTAVGLITAAGIFANNAGGCQAIATPEAYRTGRLLLLALAAALVAAWAVPAVIWRQHWARFATLGFAADALPLLAIAAMLGQPRSDWTFCLFVF
jgi:hypothetical protein